MIPLSEGNHIPNAASTAASIIISDLRIRGFTPNMKVGKTTVLPLILGPQAKDTFKLIFHDHNAVIT